MQILIWLAWTLLAGVSLLSLKCGWRTFKRWSTVTSMVSDEIIASHGHNYPPLDLVQSHNEWLSSNDDQGTFEFYVGLPGMAVIMTTGCIVIMLLSVLYGVGAIFGSE